MEGKRSERQNMKGKRNSRWVMEQNQGGQVIEGDERWKEWTGKETRGKVDV